MDHVYGYAVGLDLTRRDVQQEARKKGNPWCLSKGFDRSAPMSELVPRSRVQGVEDAAISLKVNGKVVQSSRTSKMTWSVPQIIAQLSQSIELKAGDIIFTGTPEGVGPINPGDVLEGEVEGIGKLRCTIAPSS